MKRPGEVVFSEDGLTAQVPLFTRGNVIRAYATIDAADATWVGQRRWQLDPKGYALRTIRIDGRKSTILMHRMVLGLIPRDGILGDHINRDKLDNRRANLRKVTEAGNRQNVSSMAQKSSVYRGVSWDKQKLKWTAKATMNGRVFYFGAFTDEHEAAAAARAGRLRLMPYATD